MTRKARKFRSSLRPYLERLDYDPHQWRLLPGSPGYRQGPDGKDLGADLDSVAVPSGAMGVRRLPETREPAGK